MSDDWRPGDLALCVNAGPILHRSGICRPATALVREGACYTVEAICYGRSGYWDEGELALALLGIDAKGRAGFAPARFRKIRPHEADEEDRETIRLLTGAPTKEPVA